MIFAVSKKQRKYIVFLENYASRYEAFLTNKNVFMQNAFMPKFALGLQLFSATLMLVTTLVLKILFSSVKKAKTQKRNTISFRSLNILHILWMFVTAVPFGLQMVEETPYAVSLAGNVMLFSILIANEDSREYVLMKITNWQMEQKERENMKIKMKGHLSLWAFKRENLKGIVPADQNNQMFVIDIENTL